MTAFIDVGGISESSHVHGNDVIVELFQDVDCVLPPFPASEVTVNEKQSRLLIQVLRTMLKIIYSLSVIELDD